MTIQKSVTQAPGSTPCSSSVCCQSRISCRLSALLLVGLSAPCVRRPAPRMAAVELQESARGVARGFAAGGSQGTPHLVNSRAPIEQGTRACRNPGGACRSTHRMHLVRVRFRVDTLEARVHLFFVEYLPFARQAPSQHSRPTVRRPACGVSGARRSSHLPLERVDHAADVLGKCLHHKLLIRSPAPTENLPRTF